MSTRDLMIYQIKARGMFVKKFNENVQEVKLLRQTAKEIVFSIKGKTSKKDIKIPIVAG